MGLTVHRHRDEDRSIRVGYGGNMAEEEQEEKQPERRGIVVTGDETGQGQGFVPAEEAEAAGITVTGVTAGEREPSDTEDADAGEPKASKRAAKKGSKKR